MFSSSWEGSGELWELFLLSASHSSPKLNFYLPVPFLAPESTAFLSVILNHILQLGRSAQRTGPLPKIMHQLSGKISFFPRLRLFSAHSSTQP